MGNEDNTIDNNLPESTVYDNTVPLVEAVSEKVEESAEMPISSDSTQPKEITLPDLSEEQSSVEPEVAQEYPASLPAESPAEEPQKVQAVEQSIPENVSSASEEIPDAPLYQEQSPFLSEQLAPAQAAQQQISPEMSQIPALPPDVGGASGFDPAIPKDNKKLIYIILGSAVGLLLLILIGFLGYNYYISSSNERILGAAAKNIINGKNMEVDFSVGVDGFSVNGKLFVDESQNLKFQVAVSDYSIEALYLKAKDSVYLKEFDFFGSSSGNTGKVAYYEGKNVEKAIKKYGAEDLGLDSLNPTKNYFSAENLKNFKREDDEKRDGIDLYKFSFVATDADIKIATDKANKKIAEYSPDTKIKQIKNTTTLLIKKSDFMLYRVDGNTELSYSQKIPDYSKCFSLPYEEQTTCEDKAPTKEESQKYVFKWGLDIKGGYKNTIALAKGSTISQSVDLSTYEEDMKKSANDSLRKSNSRSIQVALETYNVDNESYPATLSLLVPEYLNSMPKNPGDTKFVYVAKDGGYTLAVKLENPEKNGMNVKNGLYTISSSAYEGNNNTVDVPTYE